MIVIGNTRWQQCSHGNWPTLDRDELRAYVITQVDRHGYGWSGMADLLNRERVPTLNGGEEWRASSVRSLYHTPPRPRIGSHA